THCRRHAVGGWNWRQLAGSPGRVRSLADRLQPLSPLAPSGPLAAHHRNVSTATGRPIMLTVAVVLVYSSTTCNLGRTTEYDSCRGGSDDSFCDTWFHQPGARRNGCGHLPRWRLLESFGA